MFLMPIRPRRASLYLLPRQALAVMSAATVGFMRGVAAEIDSFIRPLPCGVELHQLTGLRMLCGDRYFVITCGAEAAAAVWRAYDRVLVSARQFIEIDGHRCWSEVDTSGVKWAGEPFPVHFRSVHNYVGSTAVIDAEYAVTVYIPSNRLWEHHRWLAGGGMVELEDQPRAAPEERDHTPPPLAHGQVAVLIEQLEAEDDDDMDDDSDSEL